MHAAKEFKPICIWCNAPWSDENVEMEADVSDYGGMTGCSIEGIKLQIKCHSCKNVIYEKDQIGNCWVL